MKEEKEDSDSNNSNILIRKAKGRHIKIDEYNSFDEENSSVSDMMDHDDSIYTEEKSIE